jgi:rhodanese-related sulfurtransferase
LGPLVPDIIGNELNFIVAIFLGVAFGFILEQAGFSTSRKLVGLFYGYDFTVLRVFFTGGVTAMLGVIMLGHFGLLDLSLIYINPTFLWSALAGGLIMGLGFVIGGFCPGTSLAAAAIGRIDAMIFVGGSFIGVLIFAEGYPLFEDFYKSGYWGNVRIFETFNMSQALFAFILTLVAVGAFWFTAIIENKVNGKPNPEFKPVRLYALLTGLAFIIGLSAFAMPDIKESYLNEIENSQFVNEYNIRVTTPDELAFRIMDDDNTLQIIDVRKPAEFTKLSLPRSQSFTLNNLFIKDARQILAVKHKRYVFVGNDELSSKKAAIIADRLGFDNISYLKGGLDEFRKEILQYTKPAELKTRQDIDTYRFREQASKILPALIEKNKSSVVPVNKTKRVLGGC